MKKTILRVTLSNITVQLDQITVPLLQVQWKVGKQVTVTTKQTKVEQSQAVILQSFSKEIYIQYDQQTKSYLSCPSSLTLMLAMKQGNIKIGGYTMFNISSILNQNHTQIQLQKTFCSVGTINFMLRFEQCKQQKIRKYDNQSVVTNGRTRQPLSTSQYAQKLMQDWIEQQIKKYQKKITRAQTKLKDIDYQKKQIMKRHSSCLQGQNQPCRQQTHKYYYKLQQELKKITELFKLTTQQLKFVKIQKDSLLNFQAKTEKDWCHRLIRYLKARDQQIDTLVNQLAQRTGYNSQLNNICLDYQKTIRIRGRQIQKLQASVQSYISMQHKNIDVQKQNQLQKAALQQQIKSLQQNLNCLVDEYNHKQQNFRQLLNKAHQRIQSIVSQSKHLSEKQLQLINQKQRQIMTFRSLILSNEQKLSVQIKQNMQLKKNLTFERDQNKHLQNDLQTCYKDMQKIQRKNQEQRYMKSKKNEQQIDHIKRCCQIRCQQMIKSMQQLSNDYDTLIQIVNFSQTIINKIIGNKYINSSYQQKIKSVYHLFQKNQEIVQQLQQELIQLKQKLKQTDAQTDNQISQLINFKQKLLHQINLLQQQNQKLVQKIILKDQSYQHLSQQYQQIKKVVLQYREQIVDLVNNQKKLQKHLQSFIRKQQLRDRIYQQNNQQQSKSIRKKIYQKNA